MINRLLNSQTKTVGAAAGILAVSTLISRILGVGRDWLLAKMFGAGPDVDVYFAAFRIPDMIYGILIAGGIVVAFLPLFAEYFSKNKEEAWRFTNNTINIFFFLLIVFCLVLFIFTPLLVKLITPGFSPEQLQKTIFLTKLMFLSPLFLGLSSIFSGILQYFNRFLAYSLAPIFYNLGIILGLVFLAPKLGIAGVALGVILGAFLHLVIQIPSAINCGLKHQPIFDFKDQRLKRIFLLMIPRTLGVIGWQINLFIITAIASGLAVGSISIFNFANNLQGLASGIIGVSFSMAVFPSLSRAWVNGAKEEFLERFSSVFRQIVYMIVPLSVLIFVLRNQIVEIVLKHGEFSQFSAHLTAASLGLFSFSIFAFSLIPLLVRAFFSFQDTKTPTLIVFLMVFLNIILSLYLTSVLATENSFHAFFEKIFHLQGIEDIRIVALPLAYSSSIIFQFVLLLVSLRRRISGINLKAIFNSSLKIVLAGILMTVVMYSVINFMPTDLKLQTFFSLILETLLVAISGIAVYFLATFLLKSPEAKLIFKRTNRQSNGKN